MTTRVEESGVVPARVERVWQLIKELRLDKFDKTIESVKFESGGPGLVGAIVTFKYNDAQRTIRKIRVVSISDLRYDLTAETIECSVPGTLGTLHTLRLRPITVGDGPATLAIMRTEFSRDVTDEVLAVWSRKWKDRVLSLIQLFAGKPEGRAEREKGLLEAKTEERIPSPLEQPALRHAGAEPKLAEQGPLGKKAGLAHKWAHRGELPAADSAEYRQALKFFDRMEWPQLRDLYRAEAETVWNEFDVPRKGVLSAEAVRGIVDALLERMVKEDTSVIQFTHRMFENWPIPEADRLPDILRREFASQEHALALETLGRMDRDHNSMISKAEFTTTFERYFRNRLYELASAAFGGFEHPQHNPRAPPAKVVPPASVSAQ